MLLWLGSVLELSIVANSEKEVEEEVEEEEEMIGFHKT